MQLKAVVKTRGLGVMESLVSKRGLPGAVG